MSGVQNPGNYSGYDNHGYVKDLSDGLTYGAPPHDNDPPQIEPAPQHLLPRIKLGTEKDGLQTAPIGFDKVYSPGYPPKNNDPHDVSVIIQTPGMFAANENAGEDDAEDDRDTWDNPIEFLLSCISMSVGLGNVWRFPGVAVRNGGGAFLIPYLIILIVVGRPLYYMEMCLGQFSRYGQVKAWNLAPMFKGVGYGSITGVICLLSYYCALMAITVFYFFASFAKDLPWEVCPDGLTNSTGDCTITAGNYSVYYFENEVFPQLGNIDDGIGKIHWRLALCLVLTWILIFLSLVKGVKSSGKVAYFTAIFPYVVLFILLIRGVTLKGAWRGIKFFIEPQWEALYKPKVWYAAVEQCFFSLSTGFGPIIMFSSYNPFTKNVYKDALIISFMDTFTSLLAGFTIFSVIGNLLEEGFITEAQIPGLGGPGLAFVVYPQALATFGWAKQLLSVLFFLMLFTLGIGSATSLAGGIITIICDQFAAWKRWLVTGVVCTIGCLLGLMYVTEGGLLLLDLVDRYGAGFIIYFMAIVECVGICWVYGLNNFCHDIEFMLGRNPGIYWRLCWSVIVPVGLAAILLYFLITEPTFTSGGIPYPTIATVCGWCLTGFAVGLVPAWGIHAIVTRKSSTFTEKFVEATKPTRRWGPQQPKRRRAWQEFRAEKAPEGRRFFGLF